MTALKRCIAAGGVLVVLALGISATDPGRTAAQVVREECQRVHICNTAADPIPVAVQGSPLVRIESSEGHPVHTQIALARGQAIPTQAVLSPSGLFQKQLTLQLHTWATATSTSFQVPAGHILLLQGALGNLDKSGSGPVGDVSVVIETSANGEPAGHSMPITNVWNAWGVSWSGTIYADPQSFVTIHLSRSQAAQATVDLTLTLSGLQVPMP